MRMMTYDPTSRLRPINYFLFFFPNVIYTYILHLLRLSFLTRTPWKNLHSRIRILNYEVMRHREGCASKLFRNRLNRK